MTKRALDTDRSPFDFIQSRPIYSQDVREVAEMANFAAADSVETLAAFHCGLFQSGGDTIRTHNTSWPSTIGVDEEHYDFVTWIDFDTQSVRVVSNADLFFTDVTADVRITLGSALIVHSHSGAVTVNTSVSSNTAIGVINATGLVPCRIELRRTAGAATARLNWMLFRGRTISAVDLPDPSG